MSTTLSMWLGLLFVFLAIAASIIQAWLWSFPMEPDPGGPDPNGKSTAPKMWTLAHRVMGALFCVIYVFMMWHMVPRLWEYQMELPARTVVHACVAIVLGVLLVTKISVIRWFQHFGKALPALGLGVLTCTIILGMLSLPFAFRAHGMLAEVYTPKNLSRVKMILSGLDAPPEFTPELLTTEESLLAGREVLMRQCAVCHDMRTILVKPRTGKAWQKIVRRMAEKPNLGPKIEERDVHTVTAYLVAISPDLQESVSVKRREARDREAAAAKAIAAVVAPTAQPTGDDAKQLSAVDVKALVENRCTECHEMTDVEEHGGDDKDGWAKVVQQMIEDEGAELTPEEVTLVVDYLAKEFPKI
jgi:cytochrome c5